LGGDAGQPFAALPQIPSYADEGDDVDALIADNAGNTISEDDPVVSGAQQVADRYNQLSASYGDAAELTAASYAITEEDRTGTIIDLTGTAPSEIQEDDSLASTALPILFGLGVGTIATLAYRHYSGYRPPLPDHG
jgi:hypothetical protein